MPSPDQSPPVRVQFHGHPVHDFFSRAVIWLYMGGLFGALYGGFLACCYGLEVSRWLAIILSGGVAAGAIAAFYSAMRIGILGVIGATASSFVIIVLDLNAFDDATLFTLIGAASAAVFGMIGALTGTASHSALPKAATGLVAGLPAAAVAAGISWLLFGEPKMLLIAAVTMLLSAAIYRGLVTPIVNATSHLCPVVLTGAAVAAGVGLVVALSVWAVVTGASAGGDSATVQATEAALLSAVFAAIGGGIGGFIAGGLSAVFRARWLGE